MTFFKRKVVIVTGSSNGIGRSTAELLARAGAKVTNDLCLKDGAGQQDILQLIGDITDESFLEQLVKKTVEKFGQLDVLVNNTGASIYDLSDKKGLSWVEK
ncbi:hypothetical protein PRIPAC_76788 [Pristionchus pacificus]|uniref:Dehydrogenase n=1 Tax=Pristionchus pacificus TaxID=54126 RepID=A0A2A6C470_PRIPA|nr:hypothetical protein PRIPAC_76788 [Pristionchus pacificus]|eukprot:PDM73032.1 dehydrogenase [Pristionchus pacificus]